MTEEEQKTVHISVRVKDMSKPIDGETTDCDSCGETVVVSGSNHQVDEKTGGVKVGENVDPEEVDRFLCQECGMEMMKYRGQAG